MVGAHVRAQCADRLIDLGLSNNRTTIACGQCQCGEVRITRPRLPHSGANQAIAKSQRDDTFRPVDISAFAVPGARSLDRQC